MVTPARKGERRGCCQLQKNSGEGQLTEELCLKCNKKFQVSIGVYASENGAVQSVQRGLLPL